MLIIPQKDALDYRKYMRKRKASQPISKPYAKRGRYVPTVQNKTGLYRSPRPQTTLKCADFFEGGVAATTTGAVAPFFNGGSTNSAGTAMARGDFPYQQFQGKTINITGIQYKVWCQGVSGTSLLTEYSNLVRLVIFQWMDTSTPGIGNVFQPTVGPMSAIQFDNYENCRVLRDFFWTTHLLTNTSTTASSNGFVEKGFIKGKHLEPCVFDINNTNFQKGGLFIAYLSDGLAVSPPSPGIGMNIRVFYTD